MNLWLGLSVETLPGTAPMPDELPPGYDPAEEEKDEKTDDKKTPASPPNTPPPVTQNSADPNPSASPNQNSFFQKSSALHRASLFSIPRFLFPAKVRKVKPN
jgi:hypothetical protein